MTLQWDTPAGRGRSRVGHAVRTGHPLLLLTLPHSSPSPPPPQKDEPFGAGPIRCRGGREGGGGGEGLRGESGTQPPFLLLDSVMLFAPLTVSGNIRAAVGVIPPASQVRLGRSVGAPDSDPTAARCPFAVSYIRDFYIEACDCQMKFIMGAGSELNPHRVLEGVHGVCLIPHSPFRAEKVFHGDFRSSCADSGVSTTNQSLVIQRLWEQRPSCMRPIRCCLRGDRHLAETIANVVTSLPFIVLGLQAPRQVPLYYHKKNLNSKLYANSLIGVGIASSLYHSSRGQLRKYLRWADYTMIATTTVCLSRAVRNENPKMLMAASAFFLPIQPLMVSVVHTGMMEVAFARRASKKPELKLAHNLHTLSSLLGGALFIADDCFPRTPYIHAAWHLAAAVGVGTCNKLLE
ncbi:hypothetical protein Taro_028678 [Colocasia esculenta]|uniref:Uncharacterized protein n=1 Tax=Colocasia esculenta TaxID=4460 RepID=A0A843VHV7_COLES|nr:hypothetical protein [Colocasia esculenta]